MVTYEVYRIVGLCINIGKMGVMIFLGASRINMRLPSVLQDIFGLYKKIKSDLHDVTVTQVLHTSLADQ